MAAIQIDYFEFTVLVEASWHAGTILRYSIMQRAIDTWYNQLSDNERRRAYEFFNRTQERKQEIQQRFLARYNPANQFEVETEFEGERKNTVAYRFEENYWISSTTKIAPEFIIRAKPLDL